MSAKAGKNAERRLATYLEDAYDVVAERVPRSVADATQVDDVAIWPSPPDTLPDYPDDADVTDHQQEHRPLTSRLQCGVIGVEQLQQIEVKYTSSGKGFAVSTLYSTHLETVGLGGERPVEWANGYYTGPYVAPAEPYEVDNDLPKGAQVMSDNHNAAAISEKGEPWVFVWKVE